MVTQATWDEKRFSHWVHENTFSPVCVLLCIFKPARDLNRLWHTVHEYGLGMSSRGCSVISLLSASLFTSDELPAYAQYSFNITEIMWHIINSSTTFTNIMRTCERVGRGVNLVQNVGGTFCAGGLGDRSLPVGSRGEIPVRGSGGRSPPEAEAIFDIYMHNFDLILNYFPHSKFWGTCPPSPKVYASASCLYNVLINATAQAQLISMHCLIFVTILILQ